MTFGQPLALALLALALPIITIYLLRGNPRRRVTSAAFLWRDLDQQQTARRSWRRPPRSLALLFQLLALAAAAVALARPSFGQASPRQLVYVLDASASMQASDVAPNRFQAAKAAIRAELGGLRPGDRATLIRLGAHPQVLAAAAGAGELARALERAAPGSAPVELRDALALAGQQVEQPLGQGSEIVVFTDGTLREPPGLGLLALPVRFVRIGERGDNQGVSSLQVRRAAGQSGRLAGFAVLTNYADAPARVPVRLLADGLPLETRLVDLPARGRAEEPFDVPPGARSIAVALGGRDSFALDDRAEVSVPENRRRSVLLVSRAPEAWSQALGALPGVQVETQAPNGYRDTGADVVVLDGFVPPRLPGGQLVLVNPPPDNGLIEVQGDLREVQVSSFDPQQPILRSLDLGALRLVKAARLGVPPWASSIAETPGGPLILQGDLDGRRVVVLGFDPQVSGLEKLITFPILVANVMDLLARSGSDPFVKPGQPLSLPINPEAREVTLDRPDGSRQVLTPRNGAVGLESADQIGRYTLRERLGSGALVERTFAVDLFGEAEADIAPRELASRPAAAPLELAAAQPGSPFWLPLVGLSLGLLGVEWAHFVRRG